SRRRPCRRSRSRSARRSGRRSGTRPSTSPASTALRHRRRRDAPPPSDRGGRRARAHARRARSRVRRGPQGPHRPRLIERRHAMKGRTSLVAAAVLTVALWIAGVVVENALPSNIADGASDAQVLAWVKHNDGTLIVGAW